MSEVSWGNPGQQARAPGQAAVFGRVPPEPRVAGDLLAGAGERQIDGAIVVRAGQAVLRIAARTRHRRLVLPLRGPVAVGPGAGDDVDVGAYRGSLLLRVERGERKARHQRPPGGAVVTCRTRRSAFPFGASSRSV